MATDLPAKACQTKDALTEVDHPLSSAKTLESCVSDSPADTKVSSIPHVSCEENVGRFQNMRKECRIKTWDGFGPFSYVCRMIQHEPNTKHFCSRVKTGANGRAPCVQSCTCPKKLSFFL